MRQLSVNNLLGIEDLSLEDIELIFSFTDSFSEVLKRPIKKVPTLRDITVANLFLSLQPEHEFLLKSQKKDFQQMFSIFLHQHHHLQRVKV